MYPTIEEILDNEETREMIKTACKNNNKLWLTCCAQSVQESGWKGTPIGQFNYWGIKYHRDDGLCVKVMTTEQSVDADELGCYLPEGMDVETAINNNIIYSPEPGVWEITVALEFQDYTSLEDAVNDYCTIYALRLANWTDENNMDDDAQLDEYVGKIIEGGYATDLSYKDAVYALTKEIRQYYVYNVS